MTRVITNFPLKARQFRSYGKKLGDDIMKEAMFAALEMVGNTAVDQFMKETSNKKGDSDYFKTALSGTKLRMRTHKLQRSISNVMDFSGSSYSSVLKKHAKGDATFPGASGKKESIRQVTINGKQIEGIIGSKVEYAAIHEFGGKAGKGLSVNIPKRPYLTPAVAETMPDISKMFNELIHTSFDREHI